MGAAIEEYRLSDTSYQIEVPGPWERSPFEKSPYPAFIRGFWHFVYVPQRGAWRLYCLRKILSGTWKELTAGGWPFLGAQDEPDVFWFDYGCYEPPFGLADTFIRSCP